MSIEPTGAGGTTSARRVAAVVGILATVIILPVGSCVAWAVWQHRKVDARVVEIVERTDHQTLLVACRQVISQRGQFRPDPNVGGGDLAERRASYPDPTDPRMPAAIRVHSPDTVYVSSELASIRIATPVFRYLFVVCFADGAHDNGMIGSRTGAKQLAEDLWFYEDAY